MAVKNGLSSLVISRGSKEGPSLWVSWQSIEEPQHRSSLIRLFCYSTFSSGFSIKGVWEVKLRPCMCEIPLSFPHTCLRVWLDTEFWEGQKALLAPLSSSFQSCYNPMIPDPICVICRYFVFIVLKIFLMPCLGRHCYTCLFSTWDILGLACWSSSLPPFTLWISI